MRADVVPGAVFPDYGLSDHREIQVGYCRLVTISTDNVLETNDAHPRPVAYSVGMAYAPGRRRECPITRSPEDDELEDENRQPPRPAG